MGFCVVLPDSSIVIHTNTMGWLPDHIWLAQKAGKGGKGKSKGWGKGKSSGWLPDHIWLAQKLQGGNYKGGSKGWGKSKGKGKGKWSTARCFKEKKVWIGGLPKDATSKY